MTTPVLAVVDAHLAAFNREDADALVAGFAEDAVFTTGTDVFVGARALRALFEGAFAMAAGARLEVRRCVVDGDTAACELVEYLRAGDAVHEFAIAAFYTVQRGRLTRVKVYREGVAEWPQDLSPPGEPPGSAGSAGSVGSTSRPDRP